MPASLSATGFEKARMFLLTQARPLERALYRHEFEGTAVEEVAEALAPYQNDNGGFGNALEPDSYLMVSSVLDTTIALAIHQRIQTPADHPQIVSAVQYLLETYRPDQGIWPIRSEASPDSPGGPWWQADDLDALITSFRGCRFNPTAEVVGYLHTYKQHVPSDFLAMATDRFREHCRTHVSQASMHDLRCLRCLLDSPAFRDQPHLQRELSGQVNTMQVQSIESDPSRWNSYCDRPFEVIDSPDHALVPPLGNELVNLGIAFQIQSQQEDGSWAVFWDWGGRFVEQWEQAQLAWKGVLTERTLRVLKAFGRIER